MRIAEARAIVIITITIATIIKLIKICMVYEITLMSSPLVKSPKIIICPPIHAMAKIER